MTDLRLQITASLLEGAAEQMGHVLQRAAFSANIKERRDFSCALFDRRGRLLAQAAHVPVHLGSMPQSVAAVLAAFPDLAPGESVVVNDPYHGGSHLPDVTLVTAAANGFVASRAHFADVGGKFAGGMGLSRHIGEEGVRLPPTILAEAAEKLLAAVRDPAQTRGDLDAMAAANDAGVRALEAVPDLDAAAEALIVHAERLTAAAIAPLPAGEWAAQDVLDDDGAGTLDIPIRCTLKLAGDGRAVCDFSASADAVPGCVNCPAAVTASAAWYVFACLARHAHGLDVPINAGTFAPVEVVTRRGSVLHAVEPSAVCAGNTETSQRVVDVVMACLRQAAPELVPGPSCGTMTSLSLGGPGWAYYETIPGGGAASPAGPGASAVQVHMTNTLNTPAEALELAHPIRVRRNAVRHGSGGPGDLPGGDGLERELEFLADVEGTLLADRRRHSPGDAATGRDTFNGQQIAGKSHFAARPGDRLVLRTPGGAGWPPTAATR